MTDKNEDGPLESRRDATAMVTYAKWGLMGVGSLVVLGWAFKFLAFLMNPIIFIIFAASAAGVWWVVNRLRTDGADSDAGTSVETEATPAARKPGSARDSVVSALDQARAKQEAFDRRLKQLQALKRLTDGDDDDSARRR